MRNIVGMDIKNNEIVAWNIEGEIKYWDLKTGTENKFNDRKDDIKSEINFKKRGETVSSSDKKWSLESDGKKIYLVNNELRAKRIASDKAKLAKWTKPDPIWHLDQADESRKSSQLFAEIFHL